MIVVASSFVIVLLSLMSSTAQAFFDAPIPGFVGDLSIYDGNGSKQILPGAESNEVSMGEPDTSSSSSDNDEEDNEEQADEPEVRGDEQTFFMMDFESEPSEKENKDGNKGGKEDDSENQSPLDPWSIVWYIGSFGGLVAFFLIVSCSEWCCRRSARPPNTPYAQRGTGTADQMTGVAGITETPPPPYHLFAPPPYDSVNYGELVDKSSGEKIDIFVISVPVPSTAHQPAPA